MTKAELRKIYLVKQKSLSAFERKQKSEQIVGRFFADFDLTKIEFLHCFVAIEKFNEIDTNLIVQNVWREFPRIETLVPRVDFYTNEIESVKFTAQTNLAENAWQILEPVEDETVEAKNIDLILIPLLCFDFRGFRVGYGKGFYDRFLRNCRADCLKVGLAYFPPIEEISDTRDFDVPLDFCVTPEKVWRF